MNAVSLRSVNSNNHVNFGKKTESGEKKSNKLLVLTGLAVVAGGTYLARKPIGNAIAKKFPNFAEKAVAVKKFICENKVTKFVVKQLKAAKDGIVNLFKKKPNVEAAAKTAAENTSSVPVETVKFA